MINTIISWLIDIFDEFIKNSLREAFYFIQHLIHTKDETKNFDEKKILAGLLFFFSVLIGLLFFYTPAITSSPLLPSSMPEEKLPIRVSTTPALAVFSPVPYTTSTHTPTYTPTILSSPTVEHTQKPHDPDTPSPTDTPTIRPTDTPKPTPTITPTIQLHSPTPTSTPEPPCFGEDEDYYFVAPQNGAESYPTRLILRIHINNSVRQENGYYQIKYVINRSGRTISPDRWETASNMEKLPDEGGEIIYHWDPTKAGIYRIIPLFWDNSQSQYKTDKSCAIKITIK